MMRVLLAVLLLLAGAPVGPVASAGVDTGPALRVPAADLERSVACIGDLGGAQPVLLVPGTTLTPEVNFSWNYARAFAAAGRPYCTVELPDRAMGDIQVAAEHIVHAIRTMADEAGDEIDVLGYSQGGMAPRWALKFWPDTRELVDDLVGLAPSNHGTLDADVICAPGCAPAIHQQRPASRFVTTLNAGQETYAGIDYTVAFTVSDQVVFPNFDTNGSSSLRTGDGDIANIPVQQVCPGHVADHLTMGTIDAVAYALAVDALDSDGPADPARIDRSVCLAPLQPGVDPVTFPREFAEFNAFLATTLLLTPPVPAEPPLLPYAR